METTRGPSPRHSKYFFVVLPCIVFQDWLHVRFLENHVYFLRQMPIFSGDAYKYLSWGMRKTGSWCYK